jgi:hypothetical protein
VGSGGTKGGADMHWNNKSAKDIISVDLFSALCLSKTCGDSLTVGSEAGQRITGAVPQLWALSVVVVSVMALDARRSAGDAEAVADDLGGAHNIYLVAANARRFLGS